MSGSSATSGRRASPRGPAPRFISADDHVQEPPDLWTRRLSAQKWADRIPHVAVQPDGSERWLVDGIPLELGGAASAAALMPDRTAEPQRWADVPSMAYERRARLNAMDADGVDAAVLYPTVAGAGGETFGRTGDPGRDRAGVEAYDDWALEGGASTRE